MRAFMKGSALFLLGGSAYVGLEKLWRGRSHGSMFLAGGTGFLLLGAIGKGLPRLPRAARAVLGAGAITAVELTAGCVFNRRWQVWDYRGLPGNYLGQVCPGYCLLWIPLAAAGEGLYIAADKLLGKVTVMERQGRREGAAGREA